MRCPTCQSNVPDDSDCCPTCQGVLRMTLHGRYTSQEWLPFIKKDFQGRVILELSVVAVVVGIVVLPLWWLAGSLVEPLLFVLVLGVVLCVLLFLIEQYRFKKRLEAAGKAEVRLSMEGLEEPGGYFSFAGLHAIYISTGNPPEISFHSAHRPGEGDARSVPIPRGHEAEAEQFADLVRARLRGGRS